MEQDISPIGSRIRARIRESGPISFAEFMEVALYDPEGGFYARPPIGATGHFVTSPHVSPAFGELLARQVAECWDLLDHPQTFTVVELGAGDGTLARTILDAARRLPDLASAIRYVAIERTEGQLEALRARGLEAAGSLAEVGTFDGCVLANELLDNVPFHRLRERAGRTVEVFVGLDGDELVEVEGEPEPDVLAAVGTPLGPGEERPVSPDALALVSGIAEALDSGYAFLFDYGFVSGEEPGPVHAYRGHEVIADVLGEPGSRDVTAAVDLEAVARRARAEGLQVWEPVTQRRALLSLGYRLWSEGLRKRQVETGDAREANRLYEARSRASILIDPAKLGGLYLLAMATPGLDPPASVS